MNGLKRYAGTPACVALLLLATFACIWQHVRLIRSGYEIERLNGARKELLHERRALLLERASLESLDRIESVASGRLGLVLPEEGQIVVVRSIPFPEGKGLPRSRDLRLARRASNDG